jgi:hypothetical protein
MSPLYSSEESWLFYEALVMPMQIPMVARMSPKDPAVKATTDIDMAPKEIEQ